MSDKQREATSREDCGVGDWVDAARVPEWTPEGQTRSYQPESVVISPEAGSLGGILPAPRPDRWSFRLVERNGRPAWQRER